METLQGKSGGDLTDEAPGVGISRLNAQAHALADIVAISRFSE